MITPGITSMRQLWNRCLLVSALSLLSSAAEALQETDVQIYVSGGRLFTTKSLFDGFFEQDFETANPGFSDAPLPFPTPLPTGVAYGFNVAGKLWYHSGIVGDPVSTAPGNPFIRIGDDTTNVIVSQTSGPQAGLQLASSLSGALHVHLPYALLGADRPIGVYGLVFQITSPSFTTSDPFVVALTNDPTFTNLTPGGVAYGEQAILSAAVVPEPSSLGLLATAAAAAGLVGIRWRRRAAARPIRALA
jgi:hypothetical protein